MTTCHCAPGVGRAWLMQPVPGGEIRRVKLCDHGHTRPARLGLHGADGFDTQALREEMHDRPVLVVEQELVSERL